MSKKMGVLHALPRVFAGAVAVVHNLPVVVLLLHLLACTVVVTSVSAFEPPSSTTHKRQSGDDCSRTLSMAARR